MNNDDLPGAAGFWFAITFITIPLAFMLWGWQSPPTFHYDIEAATKACAPNDGLKQLWVNEFDRYVEAKCNNGVSVTMWVNPPEPKQ